MASVCFVLYCMLCLKGKDLFMDLDEANLSLIDPQELTVLYVQPIHAIRVWGVGRENSRSVYSSKLYCCERSI